MKAPVMFGHAGDERATPQEFFDQLDAEFHFNLDAAATTHNAKCPTWFGEGGIAYDALGQDWGGDESVVFLNPPYSIAAPFVAKAREEADKGAVIVLLLPVRSDTKWWHKYVWDKTAGNDGEWYPGTRCRFLSGRINFELHVPDDLRRWIVGEVLKMDEAGVGDRVLELVEESGIPKMAIERMVQGMPDDCLLEGAPFPSCVVIMTAVR